MNIMENLHEQRAVAVAKRLGYTAYAAGLPRAPATCPEIMQAVSGLPVGDPFVKAIFKAYTAGFDEAADKAASAISHHTSTT